MSFDGAQDWLTDKVNEMVLDGEVVLVEDVTCGWVFDNLDGNTIEEIVAEYKRRENEKGN